MKFCSSCGTQLAEGLKFCTGCGAPIGADSAPEAAAVESSAATPSAKAATAAPPPVTPPFTPPQYTPPQYTPPPPTASPHTVPISSYTTMLQSKSRFAIADVFIIVCCALLFVWLALPFMVATIPVDERFDRRLDEMIMVMEDVRLTGYDSIFGHTFEMNIDRQDIRIQTPGLWSAAFFLFIPIFFVIAALFLVKKHKYKALLGLSLFGLHKAVFVLAGALDTTALVMRTAIWDSWSRQFFTMADRFEEMRNWVHFEELPGLRVGAGNILFFITWLLLVVICFVMIRKNSSEGI